ncbi:hypothetical protein [Nocardiopsis composta]|uniref:Uncharacterized protein n=1 Tax=Nocardiopsis composta TaxID=157465 RepID=A0A7W8QJ76_9ACTN|nr:hypothetical protein [Nocardiopsis composta]MBB5431401.1 hypothetical protein [Nocardiopsis composta]
MTADRLGLLKDSEIAKNLRRYAEATGQTLDAVLADVSKPVPTGMPYTAEEWDAAIPTLARTIKPAPEAVLAMTQRMAASSRHRSDAA